MNELSEFEKNYLAGARNFGKWVTRNPLAIFLILGVLGFMWYLSLVLGAVVTTGIVMAYFRLLGILKKVK